MQLLADLQWSHAMTWTTPILIEVPCGAEINLYVSAEL
jgi:coenzyme PQQ precursor peptide PqqA